MTSQLAFLIVFAVSSIAFAEEPESLKMPVERVEATSSLVAPEAKSDIGGDFSELMTVEKSSVQDGLIHAMHEMYAGIHMPINGSQRLGIRQIMNLETVQGADKNDAKMGSTYFYYSAPDFVKFNDDLTLSATSRLYLPTSESARFETKELGSIRNYLNLIQKTGKFELSANLLSQWYANTQDISDKVDDEGKREANKDIYLVPYAEVEYAVTDMVHLIQGIGLENSFMRSGPSQHTVNWYSTLGLEPMEDVKLELNLENDVDSVNNKSGSFQLYRDAELEYELELTISI
jgi:hypothetical protein